MGNSTSRVVGCFAPFGNGKDAVDLEFLEPLDEGLGHSFCYVRPGLLDSPVITPSNSERFMMMDSSAFDTETNSGSFRQEVAEETAFQRPSKNFSETTFKTISGASVSANASTARTGIPNLLFMSDAQEPAATFESTSSFASIPLQPVPHGSGPLNGFMSGPLERGFASGPLEKGSGFMSGPLDRGVFMSGPLDGAGRNNFSAPLAYDRRRAGLGRLMRSMSGPMRNAFSRTFTKRLPDRSWMRRFFQPMTQFMSHSKDAKHHNDSSRNGIECIGSSENDYNESRHLQWAHGKAGEDRVHVVLSEEQGWLFVGIYDGFSGPDAPDFLMNNLYRAIDKELEGLLWDYEDKDEKELVGSSLFDSNTAMLPNDCPTEEPHCQQLSCESVGKNCNDKSAPLQSSQPEIGTGDLVDKESFGESAAPKGMICADTEANDNNNESNVHNDTFLESEQDRTTAGTSGIPRSDDLCAPTKFSGQGRKSLRLFELLQMELTEEYVVDGSLSTSELGSRRMESFNVQSEGLCSTGSLPVAQLGSCSGKKESSGHLEVDFGKRENDGVVSEEFNDSKQKTTTSFSASDHRQMMKQSLLGARLRRIYRKQRSLRKKLFPWSYDWHREQIEAGDRVVDPSVAIRRCKSGPVDHDAVLHAMTRALQTTEEAYMDMVESTLDRNPELALMGSCVLVMLIKDQDVYVMNLGDSRVILAQERPYDCNSSLARDDLRLRNRSRELLVRMELDRISEESPMQDPNRKIGNINNNLEISTCGLRVKALQLSSDHCTSIQEEVMRIKGEHLDDAQAVFNDRVKGQLKVTRAFGAAFLKKPKFNEALLEMFRIDYIGTSPYVSCSPLVLHHRLCSSDRFLVLSSDGLYQYFSNDEVVSHVAWFMENMPEGDPAQYLIAELLFRAAKKNGMDFHELLDIPQGDRRKYHDDVSVMVISLEGRIWRSCG